MTSILRLLIVIHNLRDKVDKVIMDQKTESLKIEFPTITPHPFL
jgi:hypothetical protein